MKRKRRRPRDDVPGTLPLGWTWSTVGDLGDYINGFAFKWSDWEKSGRPIIRIQNLTSASAHFNRTTKKVAPRFVVRAGDILVSWSGTLDAYRWSGPTAALNQHIFKVVPRAALPDRTFLMWGLRNVLSQMWEGGHTHGTTLRHINRGPFLSHRFALPPAPEQHRIAAALESYRTRLDAADAALERVQRNLKQYRVSVIEAAVRGRLVPTEAELARTEGRDFEPASVLLERVLAEHRRRWEAGELRRLIAAGKAPKDERWKSRYQAPAGPDTGRLPPLPEGWCWASPEQTAAPEPYALAIGPFGSNLLVSDYRSDGVPLVFVRHVRAGVFSGLEDRFVSLEKARELSPHRVDPGDVVITKMGEPPGDASVYPEGRAPGIITADVLKWRLSPEAGAPRYFAFVTRSAVVHAQIVALTQGVSQKKISLQRFRTVAYPLPPAAEQHRISAEIERRMSLLQTASAAVDAGRDRLSRLRRSILRWAFEGKLADQDPNDEPASVLLGRIRAERAAGKNAEHPVRKSGRAAKKPRASLVK